MELSQFLLLMEAPIPNQQSFFPGRAPRDKQSPGYSVTKLSSLKQLSSNPGQRLEISHQEMKCWLCSLGQRRNKFHGFAIGLAQQEREPC